MHVDINNSCKCSCLSSCGSLLQWPHSDGSRKQESLCIYVKKPRLKLIWSFRTVLFNCASSVALTVCLLSSLLSRLLSHGFSSSSGHHHEPTVLNSVLTSSHMTPPSSFSSSGCVSSVYVGVHSFFSQDAVCRIGRLNFVSSLTGVTKFSLHGDLWLFSFLCVIPCKDFLWGDAWGLNDAA